MKKKHSFFWSLLIILICAGTVIIIGWPQFRVPHGQYGVLISKTSGVFDQTVTGGGFLWKWELIFPTNSRMITFPVTPQSYTNTVSGTLPSAAVYSKMLDGNPDFTYSFTVTALLRPQPESLPDLVQKGLLTGAADLDGFLKDKARVLTDTVIQEILTQTERDSVSVIRLTTDTSGLIEKVSALPALTGIEVLALSVDSYRIPDTALYATARETYAQYQDALRIQMKKAAEEKALTATSNFFDYEQLERLGNLFTNNPALLEYCTTLADKGIYYGIGSEIQNHN